MIFKVYNMKKSAAEINKIIKVTYMKKRKIVGHQRPVLKKNLLLLGLLAA